VAPPQSGDNRRTRRRAEGDDARARRAADTDHGDQERLVAAVEADQPYEAARHRARLEDLIEMATRHDIDVSAWVDRTLLRD
jgi:hypothetical protein